jgi:hypothetical protein
MLLLVQQILQILLLTLVLVGQVVHLFSFRTITQSLAQQETQVILGQQEIPELQETQEQRVIQD